MDKTLYFNLKNKLIELGYGEEIDWQTNVGECSNSWDFRDEAIWVILNSGMKEQIARQIWKRIQDARETGRDISEVFGHTGKVGAIKYITANCGKLFSDYVDASDKIAFLKTIPFIGGITCYHLAKNLGHDVVKPDRHLVRIAREHGFENCNVMCDELSRHTGDKVSVIDIVLWRSANLGLI
jgi:hypothetical protein